MAVYARSPIQALWVDELAMHVVPAHGVAYDESEPVVTAHPWAFASADEIAAEQAAVSVPIESVPIEAATANPGESRGPIKTRRQTQK